MRFTKRFASALLLCLFVPALALSQGKPVLEHHSDLQFGDEKESIVAQRLVTGQNKLVLVGRKIVRVLDMASGKLSDPHPLDVPEFTEDRDRQISPDGRRMLVFGNYDSDKKADKVKRPPTVWDLETGKLVAPLDKTAKRIRAAVWSSNGKTLVTTSGGYIPFSIESDSVEVSFWDGETLAYRGSLPTDKVGWWWLNSEGDRCIYSMGEVEDTHVPLFRFKHLSPGGPINIWNINSEKIEQTITPGDGNVERKIESILVSPDEKFLALVVQQPQAKKIERRVSLWEIVRDDASRYELRKKYELAAAPKLGSTGVSFSPDGKYFSMDVGKDQQIYETRTGQKRFELANVDWMGQWLNNDILYYDFRTRMEVFDATTGKPLYQQKLIYKTSGHTEGGSFDPSESYVYPTWVTDVLDETRIVVHPGGKMFLTYSNQYVKLFDSRTGELLQTLVSPPMDNSKKKPQLSKKPLVSKAGWSDDGRTLYNMDSDKRTISLWRLL